VIHFLCTRCGAKLRVPDTHAGKEGRCPHCKERTTVPPASTARAQTPRPAGRPEDSEDAKAHRSDVLFDAAFPVLPRRGEVNHAAANPPPDSGSTTADSQEPAEQAAPEISAAVGAAKLPWLLDMFLYPFNLAGVIHLVFLWLLVSWLCPLAMDVLGLGTEFVPLVYTLPVAYVVYYLAGCIRDSAGGACRAPDFWMAPGDSSKWECLSQFVQVVGSIAVCFWPVCVYYILREQTDWIYWLLLAGGASFSPWFCWRWYGLTPTAA